MAAEVAAAADGVVPADGALAVGGAMVVACEATFMEDLHQKAVTWLLGQLTVEEPAGVKKYTDVCHFLSAMHPSPESIQNFAESLQILDRECCKVLPLQPDDEFIQVIPVPPQPGSFSRHRVHLWQLGYVEGASMKGAPRQKVDLLLCCYCCCSNFCCCSRYCCTCCCCHQHYCRRQYCCGSFKPIGTQPLAGEVHPACAMS